MRGQKGERLRAIAAVLLTLAATMPPGYAQQAGAGSKGPDKAASELPVAPAPVATQPYPLRTSSRDYSKAFATWIGDPIKIFMPTNIPKASFNNSVRLADLMKDGKIYLSLSDALALAIENNYDIAIARYNLDIADTDILRTKTGYAPLGVPTAIVANTLTGRSSTAATGGGGPGGTAGGSGGAGSGVNGLTMTTSGAGPNPEHARSHTHQQHPITEAGVAGEQHLFSARLNEYKPVQLHVQPGFCDGHGAECGLQQPAPDDEQ